MFSFYLLLTNSYTIDIDDTDFDHLYASKTNMMLYFYGSKCDECSKKIQDFEDASFFFTNTRFVTVNCDREDILCKRMSVVSLPSIKFITYDPEYHVNYRGSYSSNSIINFTQRMTKEDSVYQRKNPQSINKFNLNSYENEKCLISAFYTPQSISDIPFFPVVRNLSRIFENEDNVTVSTINCIENPSICTDFPLSSLPEFTIYRNGKFLRLNGSSLESTVEDINKYCSTNRLVNGYTKRESCSPYYNDHFLNKMPLKGPIECIEIVKLDKQIPNVKKQIIQLLKDRNAAQDILDRAYSKLMAIEELDRAIDLLIDKEEQQNL